MPSWGYCVLVFDSFGESVARAADAFICFLGGSGGEFKVGRTTSWDEVPSIVQSPIMGFASSLWQYIWNVFSYIRDDGMCLTFSEALVKLLSFLLVVMISQLELNVRGSSDADVPLVLLAGSALVLLGSASCERSRELMEKAFDNGMYHFRWGLFSGVPWLILYPCSCCFSPSQEQSCCDPD